MVFLESKKTLRDQRISNEKVFFGPNVFLPQTAFPLKYMFCKHICPMPICFIFKLSILPFCLSLSAQSSKQAYVGLCRGWLICPIFTSLSSPQAMCGRQSPKGLDTFLQRDPHSPPILRVLGSLSNSRDFSRHFQCPTRSPLNPALKCHIWWNNLKDTWDN